MTVLLLVTWFIGTQAASSYVAEFQSMESCRVAVATLLQEALRMKVAAEARVGITQQMPGGGQITTVTPGVVPTVSAVCVTR